MTAAAGQPGQVWSRPIPSAGTWEPSGYRSGRTRAMWAQIVLGLAIGAMVASALVITSGLGLIDRAEAGLATDAELLSFAGLSEDLGNLTTILQIASAVCVLAWLHLAVLNVPALGRGTPRWSPWQSVIWWFIPIAFLLMPFAVVRDVWRRMSPAGERSSSVIVGTWWLLYLGGALGGRLATQAMNTASTVDEVRTLFVVVIALLAATAASGVLLISIIRTVEARALELVAVGLAHVPIAPAGPSWAAPAAAAAPSSTTIQPPPVSPDQPAAASGAAFCPRCATRRIQDTRYCPGCAFDFQSLEGPQ